MLVGVAGFVCASHMTAHVRTEARNGWSSVTELTFRPGLLTDRGRAFRRAYLVCVALFLLLCFIGFVVAKYLSPSE